QLQLYSFPTRRSSDLLEVSILSLRSVREKNSKRRIDSGFFAKAALRAEGLVEALPNDPLGDLAATFRKGIFDIKAETYVGPGEGDRKSTRLNSSHVKS